MVRRYQALLPSVVLGLAFVFRKKDASAALGESEDAEETAVKTPGKVEGTPT